MKGIIQRERKKNSKAGLSSENLNSLHLVNRQSYSTLKSNQQVQVRSRMKSQARRKTAGHKAIEHIRLFQDSLYALGKATYIGGMLNDELRTNLLAPAPCPLHYASCFLSWDPGHKH